MTWTDRLAFGLGRTLPVVLQTEAAECGLACLAMVLNRHGVVTDLAALRRSEDSFMDELIGDLSEQGFEGAVTVGRVTIGGRGEVPGFEQQVGYLAAAQGKPQRHGCEQARIAGADNVTGAVADFRNLSFRSDLEARSYTWYTPLYDLR